MYCAEIYRNFGITRIRLTVVYSAISIFIVQSKVPVFWEELVKFPLTNARIDIQIGRFFWLAVFV